MDLRFEHLAPGADLSDAFAIRNAVFHEEQGIPNEEDFDGQDPTAAQFMAYDGDKPIGTGRYRIIEEGMAKAERIAVLPEYRGHRVGKGIMYLMIDTARDMGVSELYLHAQTESKYLYDSLGFEQDGEPFDEVGIEHINMIKTL